MGVLPVGSQQLLTTRHVSGLERRTAPGNRDEIRREALRKLESAVPKGRERSREAVPHPVQGDHERRVQPRGIGGGGGMYFWTTIAFRWSCVAALNLNSGRRTSMTEAWISRAMDKAIHLMRASPRWKVA